MFSLVKSLFNLAQLQAHGPPSREEDYLFGKIKSKSKPKYPNDSDPLKLPFTRKRKQERLIVEEPKTVMNEAYDILIRKWKLYNPEIIESAMRIAMAKRHDMMRHGVLDMARNLTKKAQEETAARVEEAKSRRTEIDKRALWNRARFFALMRSKRGTRKWATARNKLEKRKLKKDSSFWFSAKKLVFSEEKHKKP